MSNNYFTMIVLSQSLNAALILGLTQATVVNIVSYRKVKIEIGKFTEK